MPEIKVGDRVHRTLPNWNRRAVGVVDSTWYGFSGTGFKVRFEDNDGYRENWYTNQLKLIEEENEVTEAKRTLVGPKPEPVQVPPEPVFLSPFHTDGVYIADANNQTVLNVNSADSSIREDHEFAQYVVDALNAYVPAKPVEPEPEIKLRDMADRNGNPVFEIEPGRAWYPVENDTRQSTARVALSTFGGPWKIDKRNAHAPFTDLATGRIIPEHQYIDGDGDPWIMAKTGRWFCTADTTYADEWATEFPESGHESWADIVEAFGESK